MTTPFGSALARFRRTVALTALLGFSLGSSITTIRAQHRYALDPAPNVTMRTSDTAGLNTLVPQSDGSVVALGMFNYVNGVSTPSAGLAALDAGGNVLSNFVGTPNLNATQLIAATTGGFWAFVPSGTSSPYTVYRLDSDGTIRPGAVSVPLDSYVKTFATSDGGFYAVDLWSGPARVLKFGPDGQPAAGFTPIQSANNYFYATTGSMGQIALYGTANGPSGVAIFDSTGTPLPNASAGVPEELTPFAAAFDSHGGLILSGYSSDPAHTLVRISPDGSLDTTFDSTAIFSIWASQIAVLNDGTITLAVSDSSGYTTTLLDLAPNGTKKASHSPSLSSGGYLSVQGIFPAPTGGYYVFGGFDRIDGISVNGAARVNADETIDSRFSPLFESDASIVALSKGPDGGVLFAGSVTKIANRPVGDLNLLKPSGEIDTKYPPFHSYISGLTALRDGSVVLLGGFQITPGGNLVGAAKLKPDRTVDTQFLAGFQDSGFYAAAALPNGSVLLAGNFGAYSPNPVATFVMRVAQNGSIDTTFFNHTALTGGSPAVTAIGADQAGRVYVGGSFTNIQGLSRPGLARLKPNGTIDPTFNPTTGFPEWIPPYNMTVLGDGRFYVVGTLDTSNWQRSLIRFKADGSLDKSFSCPLTNAWAYTLGPNGDLFASGILTEGSAASRSVVVRLKPNGSVDTKCVFDVSPQAEALLVDDEGRIVLGGGFTVNGVRREGIARLTPTKD